MSDRKALFADRHWQAETRHTDWFVGVHFHHWYLGFEFEYDPFDPGSWSFDIGIGPFYAGVMISR